MNKQQLAAKIWESANAMRSKIDASDYKDFILGFIFYKFLSDKELELLRSMNFPEDLIKTVSASDSKWVDALQEKNGYILSYENLYSSWLSMGNSFNISNVRTGLSEFNSSLTDRSKKVYEGIFDTLEIGLNKLGDSTKSQTKAVQDLLELIRDIPTDGKQGYDVLGFIYEYLLAKFAANASNAASEFYTPNEVSVAMSEIISHHLQNRERVKIYDSCSGSGSLLITVGKSIGKYFPDKNAISYYAQELKQSTYNLTRMNLVMRGIEDYNIFARNADTLEDDWPIEPNPKTGVIEPLRVDAATLNPPYSQTWSPESHKMDERYQEYGLAPKSKADYAFLLHALHHVANDGIMTIVLPHGVLFRGGSEETIRKKLIEKNQIDAIIGLPAQIFFGTPIPTIIMILKPLRENSDVLIVDASKGFVKEGKGNKLRARDIKKIVDTVIQRKEEDGYSRKVTRTEIEDNGFNLNIPRYVSSTENNTKKDLYAALFGGVPKAEIDTLQEAWENFPNLKNVLFETSDTPYTSFKTNDIQNTVNKHEEVQAFQKSFHTMIETLPKTLEARWIDSMETVAVNSEEQAVSTILSDLLKDCPFIDFYDVYQVFHNHWLSIGQDLEIIQTEGVDALTEIAPITVLKKKNGETYEEVVGMDGKVLPFTLIQTLFLKDFVDSIKNKEHELQSIPSKYEELFETLSEEQKGTSICNEEQTGFVLKEVSKQLKTLKKEKNLPKEETEFCALLEKVEKLSNFDKKLKKEIKEETKVLEGKTKETLENLTFDETKIVLRHKWIQSFIDELLIFPEQVLQNLISSLQVLQKRYHETYKDIDEAIHSTEESLIGMMDSLEADEYTMKGLRELQTLFGE